jgi:hypothetical protein
MRQCEDHMDETGEALRGVLRPTVHERPSDTSGSWRFWHSALSMLTTPHRTYPLSSRFTSDFKFRLRISRCRYLG